MNKPFENHIAVVKSIQLEAYDSFSWIKIVLGNKKELARLIECLTKWNLEENDHIHIQTKTPRADLEIIIEDEKAHKKKFPKIYREEIDKELLIDTPKLRKIIESATLDRSIGRRIKKQKALEVKEDLKPRKTRTTRKANKSD